MNTNNFHAHNSVITLNPKTTRVIDVSKRVFHVGQLVRR